MRITWPLFTLSVLVACGAPGATDTTDTGACTQGPDDDQDGTVAACDCDDTDPTIHPEAEEVCDGLDNDCDLLVDDDDTDTVGAPDWFLDVDGDGYGSAVDSVTACEQPAGTVENTDDCDDTDDRINPGATEVCDDADNDCDLLVDDDDDDLYAPGDDTTWYADEDGDGYGDSQNAVGACERPDGFVDDRTDCDDTDGTINPEAIETCDGEDNDCDGETDPDTATDAPTWYWDFDGDSHGGRAGSKTACEQPEGHVDNSDDCDDLDENVNPDAPEICDGSGGDEDCDGDIDDADSDVTGTTTWFADVDQDSSGDPDVSVSACTAPSGYLADDSDCDDADPEIHPGATELCDEVDNDCDGDTDEPTAADAPTWYEDADADGYGLASSTQSACEEPSGYSALSTDCDDTDSGIYPGAEETWYDGTDADCDGESDYDADGDGFDSDDWSGSDCDDTEATIHTDATELCDDVDNDCDGDIDTDAEDASTWYRDVDADGFGTSLFTTEDCTQPTGYVGNDSDCDDSDEDVNPDGTEVCYDGIDANCDEASDDDCDLDGYDSWDHGGEDCDDSDAAIYPGSSTWTVPGDFASVQEAIDDACTLDTISVAAGTYTENIVIDAKTLHIVGAGSGSTVLDGGGADTVLTINDVDDGTLEGVTVQNGYGSMGGGLTLDEAAAFTLSDVTFDANEGAHGGGVYIYNQSTRASVVLEDCVFTDNTSTSYSNRSGGLSILDGAASEYAMTNVTFEANYGGSGGFYLYGGAFTMTDIVAQDNEAIGSGGGGIVYGEISLTGATISGNTAGSNGGGLLLSIGALSSSRPAEIA